VLSEITVPPHNGDRAKVGHGRVPDEAGRRPDEPGVDLVQRIVTGEPEAEHQGGPGEESRHHAGGVHPPPEQRRQHGRYQLRQSFIRQYGHLRTVLPHNVPIERKAIWKPGFRHNLFTLCFRGRHGRRTACV
jgi:hypothetical protein